MGISYFQHTARIRIFEIRLYFGMILAVILFGRGGGVQ